MTAFLKKLQILKNSVLEYLEEAETEPKSTKDPLENLKSKSKKEDVVPYQFQCTLVRVEIKDLQLIRKQSSYKGILRIFDEFFDEVSELIARYGGKVFESGRGEIIFYFEDKNIYDSIPYALACLRDVHYLMYQYNNRSGVDFKFYVKSSVSNGALREKTLLEGYGIEDSVLVETENTLSNFSFDEGQSIYFDKVVKYHAHVICDCEKTDFLTSERKFEIFRVTGFKNIDFRSIDSLKFFRNDKSLVKILQQFLLRIESLEPEEVLMFSRYLNEYQIQNKNLEVAKIYGELIRKAISFKNSNNSADKILPTLISMGPNLIGKAGIDNILRDLFQELLDHPNQRVVANTLDVIAFVEANVRDFYNFNIQESLNNRVRANAIVRRGISKIDAKLVRDLELMLKSRDDKFRASGLWALGEIVSHHLQENVKGMLRNLEFVDLFNYIDSNLNADDEIVRNQARNAHFYAHGIYKKSA